jgi:hypothetical protein
MLPEARHHAKELVGNVKHSSFPRKSLSEKLKSYYSHEKRLRHSREKRLRHSREKRLRHSCEKRLRHSRESGNPFFLF